MTGRRLVGVALALCHALGCGESLRRQLVAGRCPTSRERVLVYVHGEGDTDDALCDPRTASLIYQRYRYVPHSVGYSYDEGALRAFFLSESYNTFLDFDEYLLRKSRAYTERNVRHLRELGVRRTPAYVVLDCRGEELARYTGPTADESPTEFSTQFRRFLTFYAGAP